MSNTYNIIGTPNADGTLKEFGNTSPKVESPAAVNVSFDNTGTSLQSDNAEDAIKEIDEKVGDTDISSIGDGTTTGAISTINSNMIKVWAKQYTVETSSGQAGAVNYGADFYPETPGGILIASFAQPNAGGSWHVTVGTRIDGTYLYVESTDANPTTYYVTVYVLYR